MSGRKGTACHRWTDAEKARLAEVAPGRSHAEIREIMTAEFGDHFGGSRICAALKRYGIATGRTGRFEKGRSGGFRDEAHRRAFLEAGKATRYRKGNVSHNAHQPLGAERTDPDGYVWVKVAERKRDPKSAHDNWELKHRIVYERCNGPIPDGHNVVFADRDRSNFDPSNLVAVPRDLWATMARRGIEYWDTESLNTAVLIAKVDRARYAAQCRPRACKRCGQEFAPRFANQRTCDACLGR